MFSPHPSHLLSSEAHRGPVQDEEFQYWGRARVFLGLGESGHVSWGAMAARALWRGLWGLMMTVGEDSGEGSSRWSSLANSKSGTVGSVFLLSPLWEDGAARTLAEALSHGRGLRKEASLSNPRQGNETWKTSEVPVRNSVVEWTAQERRPGQALDHCWPAYPPPPPPHHCLHCPCPPIPAHRNLSFGLQLGNSRVTLLVPQGVGWWREWL